MPEPCVYLKLGGSLITDKRQPETPRPEVIKRIAGEIAAARLARPDLRLILGHGSGSFGHVVGRRYGTRAGVRTPEQWYGYAATGDAAARLNRLVIAALLRAGVPAWSIQPGATLRGEDGRVIAGPHETVARALDAGLIPVVYGDVALDDVRGGTIFSTEEIFDWLCAHLPPSRIILAGEVDGLFTADPQRDPGAERIAELTPDSHERALSAAGDSHGVDVTGGMEAKIRHALQLSTRHAGLRVVLCSGLLPGRIERALLAEVIDFGTVVHASDLA